MIKVSTAKTTEWSPIQAVIILLINNSDSRFAVVRFCYHSYDYSPNWTPLSPITIINYVNNENIFNQMLQTRDLVVIISVFHFKDVTRKLT